MIRRTLLVAAAGFIVAPTVAHASLGGGWPGWWLGVPAASRPALSEPPARTSPKPRSVTHPALVIETQATRYEGESISMSLKDADLKDVMRTFATLTGLNIVVDPAVSGSVTVELHEVPWDQAFDLVLSVNGLGWEMDNNVVYVAPLAKLAQPRFR